MITIDIETIPTQDEAVKSALLEDVEVKCPFTTKADIGKDLGLDDKTIKFTGADDLKQRWIAEKGEQAKQGQGKEKWLKTALDGSYGEIVSIAWCVDDDHVYCVSRHKQKDELDLLDMFWCELQLTLERKPPIFVAHNKAFDLPFLWKRSVINEVKIPIRFDPWSREHYCTMEMWAGYRNFIGLDRLANILGHEGKTGEGCQVFDWWLAGEYEKIAEYNKADVELTRKIFNRMSLSSPR